MNRSAPIHPLIEDELGLPGPAPKTPPMGSKPYQETQGQEDLERLRKVYEPAPLLPGKTV